jgi:hypothetical protein
MGRRRPRSLVFGPDMERIGYALQPSLRVEQLWSASSSRYGCTINYIGSKFVVKTGNVHTDNDVREIIRKFLLLFRVPYGKVSYTLPLHVVFVKPVSDEMHAKYFRLIKQYSSIGWKVNMPEPWDFSDAEYDVLSDADEEHVDTESDQEIRIEVKRETMENPVWLNEELDSEIHRIYDEHFTCTAEPSRKSNFFFDASGDWCEVMEEGCYKPDPRSTSDWKFEKCAQSSFF